MSKLVIGVVGCGNILRMHWPGIERAGVRVKWLCDVNAAAAQAFAAKCGGQVTGDWRQVVADPEVQAVDVTAISALHKDVCLAAIAAGKAVICEKTLAENADDALAIVKAAEAKGTVFYTSYMKRFLPAVRKAKELLAGMGPVLSMHIRSHQPWGCPWAAIPEGNWLHTKPGQKSSAVQKYGGGVLVCCGSHVLDLLCHFAGRPRKVFALMHTPRNTDCDLLATALFDTPAGPVHYEAMGHPHSRIGYLRDGWDERVEIVAERGRLEVFTPLWDRGDVKGSLLVHYDEASGTSTEHRYPAESSFVPALVWFLDHIARGEQGEQSRLTGYDVDELIAHVGRSAASGQVLTINWRI